MRTTTVLIAMLMAAVLPAFGQHPLEVHGLMEKLRGNDDRARAEARVLLPRMGLAAAPALFESLEDPRPEVWWAAYAVIADLCNAVSVPGRKTEQRELALRVRALLAPEATAHLKTQGLRLLPQVAPENLDLGPVAHLLRDRDHRERARQALQETATGSARAVLRDALNDTDDPPFEAALCLALGQLRDVEARPLLAARLRHADPAVRAAAAWGIARAGRVADHNDLFATYRAADAATRADAGDALLVYADAVAEHGGNWTFAMAVYRQVLHEATNAQHRAAALVGLAKHGDETVLPDIVAALRGEHGPALYGPAVSALAALPGRAGRAAVAAAYPELPEAMRPALLGALARTRDPLFLPLLESGVASDDPALRAVALEGLAANGAPGALEVLVPALAVATGDERTGIYAWVRELAEDARDRGDAAAGRAYLALYHYAPDDGARAQALDGVKQFPTAEAYDVLLDSTTAAERRALPVNVIAGIAQALHKAARARKEVAATSRWCAVRAAYSSNRSRDEAEYIEILWARAGEPGAVQALRDLDAAMEGALGVEAKLGFLGPWRLAGPFPWARDAGFQTAAVPTDRIDTAASYPGKHGPVRWSDPVPAHGGLVDLTGPFGMEADATAFAATTVRVASATNAELRLGSDDGVRAWVNGVEVHRNDTDRGAALDQDTAPVRLRAGDNFILLEISQNGGGWNFIARLTGPGGAPLAFEKVDP